MGQTLTNGIFLPNEGERNCYTGLAGNWRAIDGYIGDYNVHVADAVIHVSQADRDKWDAVDNKADASALTAHTGDTTIHVTAADKEAWNGKADASALTAHTGDTTIHVTAADKAAWNGKADASALTAHTGDTTIHVTAADKAAWNGKADDADVLHKSGDETKTGKLTVTELNTTKINNLNPGALSFPDLSAGVDISGYISVTSGRNILSTYTAPADGWISINLGRPSGSIGLIISNGSYSVSGRDISYPDTHRECPGIMPVFKNDTVTILSSLADSVLWAYFYPCMGNL